MEIILASESPRRIELMKWITPSFTVKKAHIDESTLTEQFLKKQDAPDSLDTMRDLVKLLAQKKAQKVSHEFSHNTLVIGADTLVYAKEIGFLEKPKNAEDAKNMLTSLSQIGTHYVLTGVAITYQGHLYSFSDYTEVSFHPLDKTQKDLIATYIEAGGPFGKSGAYSIGDQGALLIREIKGDYYTIIGFPVSKILRLIRQIT